VRVFHRWSAGARPVVSSILKVLRIASLSAAALLFTSVAYFAFGALSRETPPVVQGTAHESLSRESCVECHAPIAAEWRESYHFLSVAGPFWKRIRDRSFDRLFDRLRVPCMNCHAPANILDLPPGQHPVERADAPELGVDCVSCHVSERGILGPGGQGGGAHEATEDRRFRDPVMATTMICAACHDEPAEHARTVESWRSTQFAKDGVTCLHCHMPEVEAPAVTGGPKRLRRSHSFIADKDPRMLRGALNASITLVTETREAIVRITNDRMGHSFPASGMNSLIVDVAVQNESKQAVMTVRRTFGTRELIPGYLDFWPFAKVSKIPYGESRELRVELPTGHGVVSAEFRYRDWFALRDRDLTFARIEKAY